MTKGYIQDSTLRLQHGRKSKKTCFLKCRRDKKVHVSNKYHLHSVLNQVFIVHDFRITFRYQSNIIVLYREFKSRPRVI